ncbi:MAG: hypothetical protein ACI96W_003283 [Paraglaciecola sp.]|jgi:hypothetical protein
MPIIRKLSVKSCLLLSIFMLATMLTSTLYAVEFQGDKYAVAVSRLPADAISIRVTGPGDYVYETTGNFLQTINNKPFLDGQYSYEITAIVDEPVTVESHESTRENGRGQMVVPQTASKVVETGFFRITKGAVLIANDLEIER